MVLARPAVSLTYLEKLISGLQPLEQDPEKPVLQKLHQIISIAQSDTWCLRPSLFSLLLCCLGNKHFSYKPDTPFLLQKAKEGHYVQGQLGLRGETLFSKETLALIPLPMMRT